MLVIPPLIPDKAQAAFNINISHITHCMARWLRRWWPRKVTIS